MSDGTPLPVALSGNMIERLVYLDEALLYLVGGALEWLCDKEPLEQTGALTVNQAKTALSDMLWEFYQDAPMLVPVGATMFWHTTTVPDRWLVCDGSLKNTADYPELFALWGYKYGGSGAQFGLLSTIDRSLMHPGTIVALDELKGEVNHTLIMEEQPIHSHGVIDPGHSHGIRIVTGGAAGANNALVVTQANVTTVPTIHTSNSQFANITIDESAGGQAHNNLHPVVGAYLIVYGGRP